MKILICHNRYKIRGGEDVVVEQEIALLRKNGINVQLHEADNANIKGLLDSLQTAAQTAYSFTAKKALHKHIQDFRPDIVHVHNFFPLLSPSVYDVCQENNVPVVQTLHNYRLICANGLFLREGKPCELCLTNGALPGLLHGCYRQSRIATASVTAMISAHKIANTWNKKVTRFLVPTQFGREKFIKYGINPSLLQIAPNFSPDYFEKNSSTVSKDPFFLYLGRLSEEKGIRTLISAWKDLPHTLCVVGDGPLEPELKSSTPKHIRFLGRLPRNEALSLLAQASALIFPTECYEGAFPLALIEALALEVPVIASNIGTIPEYLVDGRNALLFAPGQEKSLQNVIQKFSENPALKDPLRRAGRETYETNFTPEFWLQSRLKLYQEMIASYKK